MQRWQIPFLGRRTFPRQLSLFEIEQFFSFSAEELHAIRTRRGAPNRLGCALQVGFLRMTGCQLNSVRMLPAAILTHLGEQLAIAVPDIASIRALYRRERTLYEHQVFASDLLQFRSLTAHAERGLVAHLRKEASTLLSSQELLTSAHRWLYTHHYIIPSRRRLQDRVRQSIRYVEAHFLQDIDQEVPAADRQYWLQVLCSPAPNTRSRTAWEWLQTAPGHKSRQQLTEGLDNLRFLQTLGIDKVSLDTIPLARMRFYAQRMARRKASQLRNARVAGRALELVCFVRFTLLQTTDTVLTLIDQHIVTLWREARARAEKFKWSMKLPPTTAWSSSCGRQP